MKPRWCPFLSWLFIISACHCRHIMVNCNIAFRSCRVSMCQDRLRPWFSNFTSPNNSSVPTNKSHHFPFLTGQQGEIRPAPGERVQGENQPSVHVWRPREEDPRVQAAAPQLPAHHHHVQPYVKPHYKVPEGFTSHRTALQSYITQSNTTWHNLTHPDAEDSPQPTAGSLSKLEQTQRMGSICRLNQE